MKVETKNIIKVIVILTLFSIFLYYILRKKPVTPQPPPPVPPSPPSPDKKVVCPLDKNKLRKCITKNDCNCDSKLVFDCIEILEDTNYILNKNPIKDSDNNPCIFAPIGKWCLPKIN